MSDGFVSNSQASNMGGADKPAGAQEENTFQSNQIRQLVIMVRYKPQPAGGFDTGAASGMLSGVTGAIDGAVSAVESAMASIPGLNLFIKEEKKESPSEKEYTYFKDYSGWDNVFQKMSKGLKEMFDENQTDTFEFSSTDSEGRKQDAQELKSKILSKMSNWGQYTAHIHLIGLAQGGNVINECSDLLASDSQFQSEKWLVKSVVYVATPLYKSHHQLNTKCFKGKGSKLAFGNMFDLTQNVIDCFDKNEDLLKLIADSNKNVLTLATGKIKLRVIQVLAILLSGLHLSANDTSELDKFGKIKDEVTGLIGDVIDLVKQLIEEGASFIKLGDIPQFSNLMNGYDRIPSECGDHLDKFIKKFTDNLGDMAKSANVSLSPKDLAGILNCLCPLFDHMADSFKVFTYNSPASKALSQQMIDNAKLSKVFAMSGDSGTNLPVDDAYNQKLENPDSKDQAIAGVAFIKTAQNLVNKACEQQADVNAMTDQQKTALAEALSCIIQPMLASKQKLYYKLLDMLPFSMDKIKEYTADKLMSIPGGMLEKLNIDFPDELKQSITRLDGEISRIKGYFDKNNFNMVDDTLYFIYNSHNLALNKMYGPVANYLDKQTGYAQYMQSKGYNNETNLQSNNYKQAGDETKSNVMPAKELPVEG